MTGRYRTVSITGPDGLGVLGELQRRAQTRVPGELLVSIMRASAPRGAGVTDPVTCAERGRIASAAEGVRPMPEPDKLLAGNARGVLADGLERDARRGR